MREGGRRLGLWLALVGGVVAASPAVSGEAGASPELGVLLSVELVAEAEVSPYVEMQDPTDSRFSMQRHLIAQGEGRIERGALAGEMRWSLLGKKVPGHPFGRVHLAAWLILEDGAEILVSATGYVHGDDMRPSIDSLYFLTGELQAELEPQYAWVESAPTFWRGRFDPSGPSFRFDAFVPRILVPTPNRRRPGS